MKKEWAEFLRKLNLEQEFFHKDEFLKKYPVTVKLPAIIVEKEASLELLVPHAMIAACISLKDLEQVIMAKLESKKKNA